VSLEPLVYDTAPIGESVGPIAYTIPADYNRRRLAALGLAADAFLPGTGWAEPSLLCGQHSWVMRQRFSWQGSVHAKCDIALLKPVALGAQIHVTCRLAAKYERRGGRYVVFAIETRDDKGDLACHVENSMLLNFREVIARRGNEASASKPDAAVPANERPALKIGFGPATLGHDDIVDFFAAEEAVYGPHPSLHNRKDIARAAGLPDVIAPGRYSIGLLNCMFTRLYGESWLSRARYSVTFLQNLLPGLRLRAAATVEGHGDPLAFRIASIDETMKRPVLSGSASFAVNQRSDGLPTALS
jgi:acyl dehydratase